MSTEIQTNDAHAPFDDETPEANITYSFKTTEENKEEGMAVNLNKKAYHSIVDTAMRSARWRSVSQFLNDALIYYLNDESTADQSVQDIVDISEWSSEHTLTASITETLFNEIDLLVKHSQTPWYSKQVFYICALFEYIEAGKPVVERR